MLLFNKIKALKKTQSLSKHESIVLGIKETIDAGELSIGSHLPSVNNMMDQTGFARQTIVKAYLELKENGIVESKNRQGYYVASSNTNQELKVALLLYAFHTFQEIFYNTIRENLSETIKTDVFFHHNDLETFESIIERISGKYGMYIIAPIPAPGLSSILDGLPKDRLLFVDRYLDLGPEVSFVTQEFEQSMFQALLELKPEIRKYEEFILFFKEESDYPLEVLNAFRVFCEQFNIPHQIHREVRCYLHQGVSLRRQTDLDEQPCSSN